MENNLKKLIHVNLWDDYHQKPQHKWNDTTKLTVEDHSDKKIGLDEFFFIREELLKKCLEWKRKSVRRFLDGINFSRNMNGMVLDVIELDTKSRLSLFDYLRDNFREVRSGTMTYEIQMLMES